MEKEKEKNLKSKAIQSIKFIKKINWSVCICIWIFAWSSWLSSTSLWTELPLLIIETEESWRLPSILTLTAQIAQISPILVFPLLKYKFSKQINYKCVIYTKLIIQTALFLPFIWHYNEKLKIFGNRSIVLYSFNFIFSLMDGLSTVTYICYITELFENEYILSYYLGEVFSSVIPSTITFFQRISNNVHTCKNVTVYNDLTNQSYIELKLVSINSNPSFSPSIFFAIIFLFMLMSLISFIILNKSFKKIKKSSLVKKSVQDENEQFLNQLESDKESNEFYYKKLVLMILAFTVSFFLYGILPAVSSYSTLSYSYTAFNLSINLGNLILPISIFYTMFSYHISYFRLILEFLVGLGFTIYIIIVSKMSPCPPFLKTNPIFGEILIVLAWLIVEFLFMRIRCLVASELEKISKTNTLLWLGVITMIGQFSGGTLSYMFVEILGIFNARNSCMFDNSFCELN